MSTSVGTIVTFPKAFSGTVIFLAIAVGGIISAPKVTFISSVDVHDALDIVQRKTYATPIVPEKVVVGLDADPKEPPTPLTILHKPVPIVGIFPITVVDPQVVIPIWSVPALAIEIRHKLPALETT